MTFDWWGEENLLSKLLLHSFYYLGVRGDMFRGEYSYEIYKIISQTILTNLNNLHQEIKYDPSNIF